MNDRLPQFATPARARPARAGILRGMWALFFVGSFFGGFLRAEEPAKTDPDLTARDGLRDGDFNWYDRATDDLRRINVKPPEVPAPKQTTNFDFWQMLSHLTTTLIWTLIALILGLLVWVLIRAFLLRESGAKSETSSQVTVAEVDRTEALPIPIERDISNLLAAARKAYDAGNYRQAIIYLYSHELVELDKHQVIHLSKGKTNRQYLREVMRAGRKALGSVLERTQIVFEDAFFGDRAIGPAELDPCWAALGEFDRLVREGSQ